MPAATPTRPRHLVQPQQGAERRLLNDLTAHAMALQVFCASLRKPAWPRAYRGLLVHRSLFA